MKRPWIFAVALGALGIGIPAVAWPADLPVKAPPNAVLYTGGWYVWADASYQSVPLPSYDLGWRTAAVAAPADRGPMNSHTPRVNGFGAGGGIGYLLPNSTLPAALSNGRLEIGGSYVSAERSTNSFGSNIGVSGLPQLGGNIVAAQGPANFAVSTLDTGYDAFQLHAKLAGDRKLGSVTHTPSVAVFGGAGRVQQGFQQTWGNLGPPRLEVVSYSVDSTLKWTDVGVRLGSETRVEVTQWLAFGLEGTIGLAHRNVSLAANDNCANIVGITCNFLATPSTSVDTSATTLPILGKAEASMSIRPSSTGSLRGFVGLNYDSRVPGIRGPGPISTIFAPPETTRAGIKFDAETSWYAGGGASIRF